MLKQGIVIPILLVIAALETLSCRNAQRTAPTANVPSRQTVVKEGRKPLWDTANVLSGKTEELVLQYIAWGCACANWVTPHDLKLFEGDELAQHCIFIEAADSSVLLPQNFDPFKQRIKVAGRFYVRPGFPQGYYESEEPVEKARVFRYTRLRMINIK